MKTNNFHCSVCHFISGDLWAGAEVMAFHLLQAQAGINSVAVFAIVFNNGRLVEELKNAGIKVTVFEESKHSFPVLLYKVYRELRLKKIDIIHSHRQKENMLAFLVSILLGKVKLVSTLHGMPENVYAKLTVKVIFSKINFFILSHFFHRIVVVSNEIRAKLVPQKFSPKKTCTIHNGIPLPLSDNGKKPDFGQIFTIGTAGRLVPVKDFGLFIEVANLLRNNPNIKFMLAGDGPLKSELQGKVSGLGLKNISFMGHIEDMNSVYTQTDLFMNTSIHEGIPMTILEAMSRGIPVVAPQVGGMPEIITNSIDGFLIPGRDPQDFAEKCILLSGNQETYQTMALAAREKIKNGFSDNGMAQSYIQAYLQILGGR